MSSNITDLKKFMEEVHQVSKERGWWDKPHKTDLECVALMVSELAEVMEELRLDPPQPPIYQITNLRDLDPCCQNKDVIVTPEGTNKFNIPWFNSSKPEGVAVELADCILRIFDFAEFHGLPLIQALQLKNAYNQTRPYKHGKKL